MPSQDSGPSLYRARIYGRYTTAREGTLVPPTLEGLRPRAPWLRRLISRHFPPDRSARVLELGAGHGALLHFLAEAGYRHVTGVDRSPDQVAAARRLGIGGIVEGDLFETLSATADATLDVVVAIDLLEHFTKDEAIRIVDEVNRVLRVGGRWVLLTPNSEGPFGARMRYWDYTHENGFTRNSLSQLFLSSNFSAVEFHETAPVVHGLFSALRAAAWQVLRTVQLLQLLIETGVYHRDAVLTQNILSIATK